MTWVEDPGSATYGKIIIPRFVDVVYNIMFTILTIFLDADPWSDVCGGLRIH